jgi:ABC-type cobalamin/Fe3+-siderophores transport system ATPase subunit
MENLILEIENFGIIDKSEIKINKINIIAGINASGKTTVSKLLYSFLTTISKQGKELYYDKYIHMLKLFNHSVLTKLENINVFDYADYSNLKNTSISLRNLINDPNFIINEEKIDLIIKELDTYLKPLEYLGSAIEKKFKEIKTAWDLKESNSNKYYHEILETLIDYEFGDKKEILISHGKKGRVRLYENDVFEFSSLFPMEIEELKYRNGGFLISDVFYIDTPYLFDFCKYLFEEPYPYVYQKHHRQYYHHKSLIRKLKSQNEPEWNFSEQKDSDINKVINDVINGKIYYDDKIKEFRFKKEDGDFAIKNTADGEKSIGIIQSLINKELDSDSLIIMDEPEIHLHPDWQVKLAEIIVLLSKKENIKFYVNSHSPQFVEAIETYSMKYGIEDDVNYYLAENSLDDSSKFNINPVEHYDLVKIYNHLGQPYRDLAKIKGEILAEKTNKGSDSYELPN